MSTRLCNVVVDAVSPATLADFWARLLGWRVTHSSAEEVVVCAPEGHVPAPDLVFVPVRGEHAVKNRVHPDLQSESPDHQASTVAHALSLGAVHADIGQGNVPWVVMADPEGNEFCVLDPRPEYAATGALAAIVVDAADPRRQAVFWTEATGWPVVDATRATASLRARDGRGTWLEFIRDPGRKTVKNRVHLDVAPHPDDDHRAEVTRLLAAGAHRADIGQGDVPWVVMADPEGNEFCVLSPR
jgi:hypothetical protein